MRNLFSALLIAVLLCPLPALAQAPQPTTAEEEWDPNAVVITKRYPGPALWRVKRGDSEVYILGGLPVMVRRYDWDRTRMGKILDRANVLLTGPEAKAGPIAFTRWQFAKGNGPFKSLYDVLPGKAGGKFWRIAEKNGLDPKDYKDYSPVYAVMKLREDVYEKHGLSTNDPEKMLIFMARDRKTPMKPIAKYSASSLIGKLGDMDKPAREACVMATLNEIDFATGHAQKAMTAWANADLLTARANSPSSATLACLEGASSTRAMLDRATDDTVSAIDAALSKPGKSVIAVPLSVLLRPDGALERLKAKGDDISEPEM